MGLSSLCLPKSSVLELLEQESAENRVLYQNCSLGSIHVQCEQRTHGCRQSALLLLQQSRITSKGRKGLFAEEAGEGKGIKSDTGRGKGIKSDTGRHHMASAAKQSLPSYQDLLNKKALTTGERVFCTQRKGRRFYGDLLPDGRIGFSKGQTPDLNLNFPSPTAFNNFCGKLADPSYNKGNGFCYTFHKPPASNIWMPLDYYRWSAFGISQQCYPPNFKPGDPKPGGSSKPDANKRARANNSVESLFPYGFREHEPANSAAIHMDEAEVQRINSLVSSQIEGVPRKALGKQPRRKGSAHSHSYPNKQARRQVREAKKQLRDETFRLVVHEGGKVPEGTHPQALAHIPRADQGTGGAEDWCTWAQAVHRMAGIEGLDDGGSVADVAGRRRGETFRAQIGDRLEFVFSADKRDWKPGTVVSVDDDKETFEACIEVPESGEFLSQSIYQSYSFFEHGTEFCWPGERPLPPDVASSRKAHAKARGREKGSAKTHATGPLMTAAEKNAAAAIRATAAAAERAWALAAEQCLTPGEQAQFRALRSELKTLTCELKKRKEALTTLAEKRDLIAECEALRSEEQALAVKRSALLDMHGSRQCVVCWDRVAVVALNPCGHVCVCDTCSGKQRDCPLCRTRVTLTMRIFFSNTPAILPSLPRNFLRPERHRLQRRTQSDTEAQTQTKTQIQAKVQAQAQALERTQTQSLLHSPDDAAKEIEAVRQRLTEADKERCDLDGSIKCGSCAKLFATCAHSHAVSLKAWRAEHERLTKARNHVLLEHSALLEWELASHSCRCVMCTDEVMGPSKKETSTAGEVSVPGARGMVEGEGKAEDHVPGGLNCKGCGNKPGCHKKGCLSLRMTWHERSGASAVQADVQDAVRMSQAASEEMSSAGVSDVMLQATREMGAQAGETSIVALTPCGHVCVCDKCAGQVKECPWCKVKVLGFLRIFLT
jgi:hypothetical protein